MANPVVDNFMALYSVRYNERASEFRAVPVQIGPDDSSGVLVDQAMGGSISHSHENFAHVKQSLGQLKNEDIFKIIAKARADIKEYKDLASRQIACKRVFQAVEDGEVSYAPEKRSWYFDEQLLIESAIEEDTLIIKLCRNYLLQMPK